MSNNAPVYFYVIFNGFRPKASLKYYLAFSRFLEFDALRKVFTINV